MKIIKVKVKCPKTGEFYYVNKLVPVESASAAISAALAAKADEEAAAEAAAITKHRALRPSKQKIGF